MRYSEEKHMKEISKMYQSSIVTRGGITVGSPLKLVPKCEAIGLLGMVETDLP